MSIMQVFSKTYELPLAKTYVRHWGMAEGIREIIQNALDSESPFEYEFGDDSLIVRSRHARLSPSTLLLGATSKADNKDTIGSFGEGYKIALLVLVRAGYQVIVHNGDRTWTPKFRHSKQFEAEVLCIEDAAGAAYNEGLAFEVRGLSPSDKDQIVDSCLHMQSHIGAVMQTSYGLILRERPGKLYVGGLYVCDTALQFGYDVKPQFLRLERDRQTVSNFDLQWLTKNMWFETQRHTEIAALIEAGCKDLECAQHSAPELVKEACYRLFQEKHPGAVIAQSQEELQELVKQGMTNVVVHTVEAFRSLVSESKQHRQATYVRVVPPEELMREFFSAHRQHMRTPAIVAFKQLIEQSAGWGVK